MIAQVSPLLQGQPQQQQPQQPGGFQQANPMQKTIVAGMAPQIQNGQFMPQPGMQQQPGMMQQPQQGANKTILLQPTDGIVSVAAAGGPVSAQPMGGMQAGTQGQVIQGASTLFWIVSLVIGIAVGALAYAIVLQM
jgi:hypothetical protein